ncbi:MAG: hypothetical protein P8P74_05450 [Crocinitomicaceae bacterium]|nr:hypothetical protein [Crocinitomicaceae bacterium]
MEDDDQQFDDESNAPWIEFKADDVLLLGEPGSDKSQRSKWTYDKALGIIHLNAFEKNLTLRQLNSRTTHVS